MKELLGEELIDGVYAIKEDENKLNMLFSLCTFLLNNKRENDFEKLKDLLFYKENILISINGSKYLNRFSDFDATFDQTNEVINLKAEILNGAIGQTLRYDICEAVKKDSIFHCKDEDGETLLIEFSIPISL
jgi:hypothetical protein